MLLLFSFCNFVFIETYSFHESNNKVELKSYIEHEPIEILNDTAFSLYGFEGTGTEENPYVIENYKIESFGFLSNGIYVTGTSSHFIIRNCYTLSEYIGINVHNVATGTAVIANNTCIGTTIMGGGIGVSSTTGFSILDNTCSNFANAIHTNEASDMIISGNTVSDCLYHGISIRYSNSAEIINNRIENCTMFGVIIMGFTSSYSFVYQNTLIDNGLAETYNVDNERFGNITSQAYDEGMFNVWYHEESKTGNTWSDYSGEDSYSIDGPSDSEDIYPQAYTEKSGNSNIQFISTLVGIISLVILKSKKLKKEHKL
jgi:parallel beta-helix repeat protein